MASGAGVLISALAFDLMDEAYERGGFISAAVGFLAGYAVYSAANWGLSRRGAKHRKRSHGKPLSESEAPGSDAAIAVGALLDCIPVDRHWGEQHRGRGPFSIPDEVTNSYGRFTSTTTLPMGPSAKR